MLGKRFRARMDKFSNNQHFADFGMGEGQALLNLSDLFPINAQPLLTGFGFETYADSWIFRALMHKVANDPSGRLKVKTGSLFSAIDLSDIPLIDIGTSVGGIFSYTEHLSFDLYRALKIHNPEGGELFLSFNIANLSFQNSRKQVLPLSRFFNYIQGVDVEMTFIDAEPYDLVQVSLRRNGDEIAVPKTRKVSYRDPRIPGQPVQRVFEIIEQ